MVDGTKKMFRIRKEALDVIAFLVYDGIIKGIPKDEIFNHIIYLSNTYLKNNNITFNFKKYDDRRIVRGYKLELENLEAFSKFQNEHNLEVAEAIELFIYIYAYKILTQQKFKNLGIHNWGIKLIENNE